MELDIYILPDGTVQHVYNDALAGLLDGVADVETRRASHVEPDGRGGWTADLTPVNGPVLGPFALRAEALEAELEWLANELSLKGVRSNVGAKTMS